MKRYGTDPNDVRIIQLDAKEFGVRLRVRRYAENAVLWCRGASLSTQMPGYKKAYLVGTLHHNARFVQ